jgi:two-component system nitrogen regulation sensor histidine kinase GlnL
VPRDPRRLLDAVLDGVIVLDAQGTVEQLNSGACRILSTSTDAMRGRPVEELPVGSLLARIARSALTRGSSAVANEQRLSRRSEPDRLVDVAASPLLDAAGSVDGAVVLLRDRTIGNTLREFWQERERLDAFGSIASGIAHEVKNPLGGIRGAAELLVARAGDGKTRETASLIVREVDRIATLVDDFMLLARGSELRPRVVNLHRVLEDVLALLAMDPLGTRAKVVRRFDPSIPELLADADRLMQVFLNLVRNALEAMDAAGGTLTISTRMSLDHHLDPGEGERVPTVAVEIRDSGCGIAKESLSRVTTPFFTTTAHGSGLGLALVRQFVALHNGTFQIESTPGQGTTARVNLPLRRPS